MNATTVLIVLISMVGVTASAQPLNGAADELTVHFIDVGQGDCIYITTPYISDASNPQKRGIRILIDGGDGRRGDTFALRYLSRLGLRPADTIDYVIATHPDGDHIGGLLAIYDRYHVTNTLYAGFVNTTATYDSFIKLARDDSRLWYGLKSGEETLGEYLPLGDEVEARILNAESKPIGKKSNNSSIVLRLAYRSISFLLMGDAQGPVEEKLIAKFGSALRSTVIKLGHHGSSTDGTSGAEFLGLVRPQFAVISAGCMYGHPNVATGNRLWNQRVNVVRTDCEDGTVETPGDDNIVMTTNGTQLEIRQFSIRD
jgi:competence protein ComEC